VRLAGLSRAKNLAKAVENNTSQTEQVSKLFKKTFLPMGFGISEAVRVVTIHL